MKNIKQFIPLKTLCLMLLSLYIPSCSSPIVDNLHIKTEQLTPKVENNLLDSPYKDPETMSTIENQGNQDDAVEEETKTTDCPYEEAAIAGTTVIGAGAIGATTGAIVGGIGTVIFGSPAALITGTKVGATLGTGCGVKIAVNNFNKKEKSLASKVTTECGKAALVGSVAIAASLVIALNPFVAFGVASAGYLAPNAVNTMNSEKN